MTLSEYGIKDFIFAKRPPREYSPRLNRLRFMPDNGAEPPDSSVNFGAHPYANGLRIKKTNPRAICSPPIFRSIWSVR